MFCIIIEWISKILFFCLALCANMAAVRSGENHPFATDLKKKDRIELLLFRKWSQRKLAAAILLGKTLRDNCACKHWRENHLDATRERHVFALNSEEGTFFSNVILPMAYSKPYPEKWSQQDGAAGFNFVWARTIGYSIPSFIIIIILFSRSVLFALYVVRYIPIPIKETWKVFPSITFAKKYKCRV